MSSQSEYRWTTFLFSSLEPIWNRNAQTPIVSQRSTNLSVVFDCNPTLLVIFVRQIVVDQQIRSVLRPFHVQHLTPRQRRTFCSIVVGKRRVTFYPERQTQRQNQRVVTRIDEYSSVDRPKSTCEQSWSFESLVLTNLFPCSMKFEWTDWKCWSIDWMTLPHEERIHWSNDISLNLGEKMIVGQINRSTENPLQMNSSAISESTWSSNPFIETSISCPWNLMDQRKNNSYHRTSLLRRNNFSRLNVVEHFQQAEFVQSVVVGSRNSSNDFSSNLFEFVSIVDRLVELIRVQRLTEKFVVSTVGKLNDRHWTTNICQRTRRRTKSSSIKSSTSISNRPTSKKPRKNWYPLRIVRFIIEDRQLKNSN